MAGQVHTGIKLYHRCMVDGNNDHRIASYISFKR
jgi:hypothetical protein